MSEVGRDFAIPVDAKPDRLLRSILLDLSLPSRPGGDGFGHTDRSALAVGEEHSSNNTAKKFKNPAIFLTVPSHATWVETRRQQEEERRMTCIRWAIGCMATTAIAHTLFPCVAHSHSRYLRQCGPSVSASGSIPIAKMAERFGRAHGAEQPLRCN